ncbi:MAG: hypothetical protein LIO80_01805 [Lachnospiraceae bacterium]|nr:hypothetical protein [Lachnospiraceae bacterium]
MKNRFYRGLTLCLCLSMGLVMLTSCGSEAGAGEDEGSVAAAESSAETADSTEETGTSAESDESEETWQVMTLEDSTEISVRELEEGATAIYGYYTCENDGSAWAFGGDTVGVAYIDEESNLSVYVYSIDFYQTEEDEDGMYYLCVLLNNEQEGVSTCWYVMNVLDSDGNTTGMVLQNPGDEEEYIYLTLDSAADETEESTAADEAEESSAE